LGIRISQRTILIKLILIFFSLSIMHGFSYAADLYGVIIISDSGAPDKDIVSKKIEDYVIKLRDLNENKNVIKKDILWVKSYDYNNRGHAEFIRTVLGVSRKNTPFAGLARLKPDKSFGKYLPGMKMSNISDPRTVAEKILLKLKSLLPPEGKREEFQFKLTGISSITTAPPGAQIYLDDKLVGNSPYRAVVLEPGQHNILVKKNGFEDFKRAHNFRPGSFEELDISLELAKGRLEVNTTPSGATLGVDGKKYRTPATVDLKPGSYNITISKRGYKKEKRDIEIRSNSKITENIKLKSNKVKCFLEVKGGYAKVTVKTKSGGRQVRTFIIDPQTLTSEMNKFLNRQDLIEAVGRKGDARIHLLYEALPRSPVICRLTATDIKNNRRLLQVTGTQRLPPSASDNRLIGICINIMKTRLLRPLNRVLFRFKSTRRGK